MIEASPLERLRDVELKQVRHDEKMQNLENWVKGIHKSVKGLEKKASMLVGAFVVFELVMKYWKPQ